VPERHARFDHFSYRPDEFYRVTKGSPEGYVRVRVSGPKPRAHDDSPGPSASDKREQLFSLHPAALAPRQHHIC
jgi:hypothetical protein